MYNAEYFFVANPLNRYNVSSRSKFKPNSDGSIDVYIQNESPGQGQGSELAAGAEGQVHIDAAVVLAAREAAVASRRKLEDSAGREGRLAQSRRLRPPASRRAAGRSSERSPVLRGLAEHAAGDFSRSW